MPQYKYATEMMNEMNPEEVFRKLLDQPITMKLGEILGSSYELGKRFQTVTRSQWFAIPQTRVTPIEVVHGFLNQEEEDDSELCDLTEFIVNSGEASSSNVHAEEVCDMSYQRMLQ